MTNIKPWLAPDVQQSLAAGTPDPWLAPDMTRAITAKQRAPWFPLDVGEDIDSLSDGGGGGTYVAKAVHFDGSSGGVNAAFSAADSPLYSFSLWAKPPISGGAAGIYFVASPDNEYTANMQLDGTGQVDTHGQRDGGGATFEIATNGDFLALGVWHHFCGAMDTTTGAATLYVDGILAPTVIVNNDTPFSMVFTGAGFAVPDAADDGPPTTDMSDVWWTSGIYLDFSNSAVIGQFRDVSTGKPKNPTGFPSAPIILSGDKDTFFDNLGTAGSFTLTGTLTNASTSPSD